MHYDPSMAGKISSATERALKRVGKGQSIRSSAIAEKISPSTLFRALKRIKNAQVGPSGSN
jgi:DNA-binding CsgD family transcriptional regulator